MRTLEDLAKKLNNFWIGFIETEQILKQEPQTKFDLS
jgi:hypothetical protein